MFYPFPLLESEMKKRFFFSFSYDTYRTMHRKAKRIEERIMSSVLKKKK